MAVWEVTSTMVPPPAASMPGSTAWMRTNGATALAASFASSWATVQVDDGHHAARGGVHGVVDQQVDAAPRRLDPVDRGHQRVLVVQVGHQLEAPAPGGPDRLAGLLEAAGQRSGRPRCRSRRVPPPGGRSVR